MSADATPPPPLQDKPVRLRVLVVEDNKDTARSLAILLGYFGHEACVAFDGFAALKEAARNEPDAVLLDIGLPGMDGWEIARRLRAQAKDKDKQPLIIAVTGYGQEEDRRRSAEAGIDLHLLKPADPKQLEAVLRRRVQSIESPTPEAQGKTGKQTDG